MQLTNEQKVFAALLEHGSGSYRDLAKWCGIPPSSVHGSLIGLRCKGKIKEIMRRVHHDSKDGRRVMVRIYAPIGLLKNRSQ